MTLLLVLLAWILLFGVLVYVLWARVTSHLKVYWLIVCNGIFLVLIFWFFPVLQELL